MSNEHLHTYMHNTKFNKEDIVGYECQHAFYTKRIDGRSDMLFLKEYIHLKDGRKVINTRKLIDHPRKYWITQERYRTYRDKLEWIEVEQCNEYEAPHYAMAEEIALKLRKYTGRRDLRTLAETNYVHGADISPQSLIRQRYRNTYPECRRPLSSMATFDLETDMIWGTGEPIIAEVSFKDRACLAISRKWLDGEDSEFFIQKVRDSIERNIGEHVKARNINVEIVVLDSPGQIVAHAIKRLHEWKPDFVNVWNISFDIPKCIEWLEYEGYDLADVFSDPDVPREYRHFHWTLGPEERSNRKGKVFKLKNCERWHDVDAPASFQWVDGMLYYYQRRKSDGMMSVGLDACMDRHCKLGKLKFEVDNVSQAEWHRIMQRTPKHRADYCAYALWDGVGLEILDEETGDVGISLVEDIGFGDICKLPSMPTGLAAALHYFVLNRGWVMSCASGNMETPIDRILVDVDDWIVALPTYNVEQCGMRVIKGMPWIISQVFAHVFDADVIRTYPTVGQLLGVSKETTYRERTINVRGMSEADVREWGVNLSTGEVNAVELCVKGLSLPRLDQLLVDYKEHLAAVA